MTAREDLTETEKEAVQSFLIHFRKYMETSDFQNDQRERRERCRFFQEELPLRLSNFSESDFEEVVNSLWASSMWGNKTYLAQKIISENGLDKLKKELGLLLNAGEPEEAYGRFLRQIKGLGPAYVTEILTYKNPKRCGIWNNQARSALKVLGITEWVNPNRYELSVDEYKRFNRLLRKIAEILSNSGIGDVDLLLVDFFLYEVGQKGRRKDGALSGETKSEAIAFDHNEIRDLIAQIGASLGFDTDVEVKVAHGAVVDAVWRARIANLGSVTYVFEVHRSGSIDSLILNLQKARTAPYVQKVIAVSDEKQLEKVKLECEGLPEEFRRSLRFWPVSSVKETAEHLQKAMESVSSLGLVGGKSI